jgi:hypothetical protein
VSFRPVALSALAGLLALSTRLVSAEELSAKVKATKKSEDRSGPTIGFQAGTGFGIFQDVQVPLATNEREEQMRGDGKSVGEENADHMGTPLYAGLSLQVGDPGKLSYEAQIDHLMMRATSGPAETQSASYARTNLVGGARYAFGRGGFRPTVAAHAILRRSSFNNVSNGHYVNARLLRGGIGLRSEALSVEAYASYAPYTEFGFNSGKGFFGGKAFDNGSASMSELGLLYSHKIHEAVWIDLGVEQEIVQATLGRVGDYSSLGLAVAAPAAKREYELVTSTARIGVRKQF